MPDGGLCADIALVGDDVFVTDTLGVGCLVSTATDSGSAGGGTFAVWSADRKLSARRPAFLQINGIAFDGARPCIPPTTAPASCLRSDRGDGAAEPPRPILLFPPMMFPDGIRWRAGYLYVAEQRAGAVRVDPRTGTEPRRSSRTRSISRRRSCSSARHLDHGGPGTAPPGQRAAEPPVQGSPAPHLTPGLPRVQCRSSPLLVTPSARGSRSCRWAGSAHGCDRPWPRLR